MVAAGDPIESSDVTTIEDYTIRKPLVRLVQSVAQLLANNTETAITFTTEDIDTHGFHDSASNTTRISPTIAGYYRFTGTLFLSSNAGTTLLSSAIGKNGVAQNGRGRETTQNTSTRSNNCFAILAANGTNDYFELFGQQLTGVSLNTNVGAGGFASVFEAEFLRPL